jgi:murein DD-endopeptidase MepM/ murein hydrolase activator NlpD
MRRSHSYRQAGVERLESRVLMNAPPQKFVLPIGGTPQVDWAVTAYLDMDSQPTSYQDYRGRQYTFDGNDSLHFGLPDFAAMDRGVDVYAAAAGTVVEAHDGEYDRHVGFYDAPPPDTPDNYVLIDHGDGWQTRYGRLRNGSVAVLAGQVVTPGQKIALVGGSGAASPAAYFEFGAVLRFKVTHDGTPVETYLDPQAFWQSPLPFAGDTRGVHEILTTNSQPTARENAEHISRRRVFHPGERVFSGTKWHGINREVTRQNRFYRPDGTLAYADTPNTGAVDVPMVLRHSNYLLPIDAPLGEWQVSALLGGVEVGRTTFEVKPPDQGLAEIKVMQGNNHVIDGRTTPIDFGTVERGAGPSWRVLEAINHGTAPLELRSVTLPDGYSLVSGVPATIEPMGGQDVIIQLDDQAAGTKAGRVSIETNDTDNLSYDFAVIGTVSGVPTAVEQVFVSGAGWTPAFREHLQSIGAGGPDGFALPADAPVPGRVLPWSNLDRVSLRLNQDVAVSRDALSVRGVNVADYPVADFLYDAGRRTATWTLGRSVVNDRVTLTLAASVMGGAWSAPLSVLPGDSNGSGVVLADDFAEVKRRFFTTASSPGSGDAAYSAFHDVDGSGSILANDFSAVKQRFFSRLPEPQAGAFRGGVPGMTWPIVMAERVRRAVLTDEARLLA